MPPKAAAKRKKDRFVIYVDPAVGRDLVDVVKANRTLTYSKVAEDCLKAHLPKLRHKAAATA